MVVNLGRSAQTLDLSPYGSTDAAYTSMVSAAGTATSPINAKSKLSVSQGTVPAGGRLTLPPYSIASWLFTS